MRGAQPEAAAEMRGDQGIGPGARPKIDTRACGERPAASCPFPSLSRIRRNTCKSVNNGKPRRLPTCCDPNTFHTRKQRTIVHRPPTPARNDLVQDERVAVI